MAITIDPVVVDYLTALKTALTVGTDTGDPGAFAGDVHAAAQNYLRAQDMATALELLTDALVGTIAEPAAELTVVTGTTTALTDGVSTFVAGAQVGNTVTFASDTTTVALRGVSRVIVTNDTTTLNFPSDDPMPGAAAVGDEYLISNTMLEAQIATLREGKGIADATPSGPYGHRRDAIAGLMLGVERLGGTVAERSVGAAGLTALDGSTDTVVLLSGGPYRIDQFKGYRVAVDTAGEGFVVSSNETSVTLRGPMAASAAAADAVTITVPTNDFGGTSAPKIRTHPGAQPGENAVLADLINQLQVLVAASTVAT
jgi:hypothetical protein